MHVTDLCHLTGDTSAGDAGQLRRLARRIRQIFRNKGVQQRPVAHGNFGARIDESAGMDAVHATIYRPQPAGISVRPDHGLVRSEHAEHLKPVRFGDRKRLAPEIEDNPQSVDRVEAEVTIGAQPGTRQNRRFKAADTFLAELQIAHAHRGRLHAARDALNRHGRSGREMECDRDVVCENGAISTGVDHEMKRPLAANADRNGQTVLRIPNTGDIARHGVRACPRCERRRDQRCNTALEEVSAGKRTEGRQGGHHDLCAIFALFSVGA